MDRSSPQFSGDAEECSSSESGWTMYLASPIHDGSNGDDDDDDGEVDGGSSNICGQSTEDGEGKEDDDSMASDASSGIPCKQWRDDGMCLAKHGNVCNDDGGVVKDRNSQCSSRYSRKNHKVETEEEKGILSKPSDQKGENGDSISIHSSSKMRRVKSGDK